MKRIIVIVSAVIAMCSAAQSQSLTFNQVLLVSSTSTVPAGRVWKVESVLMPSYSLSKYTASMGSGSCGSCNGSTTQWTTFTTSPMPITSLYGIVINGTNYINAQLPVWLPAGTTVVAKGPTENTYTNAGCYSGYCPPAAYSLTGMMTVIEFTVP